MPLGSGTMGRLHAVKAKFYNIAAYLKNTRPLNAGCSVHTLGLFHFSRLHYLFGCWKSWKVGEIALACFGYPSCFCVWSCNLAVEDRDATRKRWQSIFFCVCVWMCVCLYSGREEIHSHWQTSGTCDDHSAFLSDTQTLPLHFISLSLFYYIL